MYMYGKVVINLDISFYQLLNFYRHLSRTFQRPNQEHQCNETND